MTTLGAIDVHSHVVPFSFPTYLGQRSPSGWPSMTEAHACHRHVVIDGKTYRTVSDRCWDVTKRIQDLDGLDLGLQIISPMPELLSYWLPSDDAIVLIRYLNEVLAEMANRSGGRLLALGAVPLQDVDRAVDELHVIMKTPGFVGVEIGSNVNGTPIGAAVFDSFFEEAESLGAAVFVHGLRPTGTDRLVGPKQMIQALGYPTDVGLAAASFICSNQIVRRPKLRIAFSHGGGTLGTLLPRLEQAARTFPPVAETLMMDPRRQAQRLFYDTLVFDGPTLEHLAQMFGDDRLMIGTDYPFPFRDERPNERLDECHFSPAARHRLAHQNAATFLGLSSGRPK